MAHAHAASGVVAAVRAGVRSIEHGTLLTEEAVSLMAERGTYLVPTLSAPYGVLEAAAEGATLPTGSEAKARELIEHHAESFRLAMEAGVPIAMGTDAPVWPHGRNLEELGAWRRRACRRWRRGVGDPGRRPPDAARRRARAASNRASVRTSSSWPVTPRT